MNWQHFQAFIWLRWRLLVNQSRRAGTLNAVLMTIIAIGAAITAIPLLIATFMIGVYAIPKATPVQLMYVWDGLILGFLFFWGIGLVTELQRTEPLSLSRFLHLPVSVNGAFLINYLSSLVRLSLIVFGPVMLGYSLALIWTEGIAQLPVLPSLAAFFLMITALTYQFQGWLASLMSNPRRRRTVVVVTTLIFVLVFQLPNLLNVFAPWSPQLRADRSAKLVEEMNRLNRDAQAQKFDAIELVRRQQEIMQGHQTASQQADREIADRWEKTLRLVNKILPVTWLPMGVMAAAEGRILPSILGLLGMTSIGAVSLWRAYRTTIGLYQGQPTNRNSRPTSVIATPASVRKPGTLMVEAHLPGLSEPVSVIALAGFRSLVRSPEAKMMLLTPVIMSFIFGSMLFRQRHDLPESLRPLIAIGGMGVVLLGVLQLMSNQFGFDRDGFRTFVMCAAPRRDILLGKNLSFAPVALGMAAILLTIVQIVNPLRLDHFLAMIPQYISMFFLCCIGTNLLSIYAPVHVAAGSLKPSNPKVSTVLLQLAMVFFLFPLTQGATLLPLGMEVLLRFQDLGSGLPIRLLLSLAECAVILVIYRFSLIWQGRLLQSREQKILEIVTNRAP